MITINAKHRKIIFWTLVCAVIFLYAFTYFAVPWHSDDLWYKGDIRQFGKMADGSYSLWHGIKEEIIYRYYNDNARLVNILGILLLNLPHWCMALPLAISFAGMFLLMIRLADINWQHIGALTVMVAIIVALWPWQEAMFSMVFAYNYIVSSFIFLIALTAFLRDKNVKWWWMFALGLLVGVWHESFGVALAGGGLAVVIFNHKMSNRGRIAMLVGAAIGVVWFLLVPGTSARSQTIMYSNILRLGHSIYNFCFIAVWVAVLCIRSTRDLAKSPISVFTIVVVIGMIVLRYLVDSARCAFPSYVMTAICYAYYIVKIAPRYRHIYGAVLVLIWTLVLAHLACLAVYAVKISRIHDKALEIYLSDECRDGTVYIDFPTELDAPRILGVGLVNEHYLYRYNTTHINRVYDLDKPFCMVPSCFKGYRGDFGDEIPGGSGVRLYNNYLIVPDSTYSVACFADYGHGMHKIFLKNNPFVGADGKQYYFAVPYIPFYERMVRARPREITMCK